MNTEQELRSYFQEKYSSLTSGLNGEQTADLSQLRHKALDSFNSQGFPQNKSEEYKYTPITKTLLKSLRTDEPQVMEPQTVPPFNEYLLPDLQGHLVVFWNGRLVYCTDDLPHGLSIEPIDPQGNSLAESGIGTIANYQKDAFTALNTALFNHGAFIRVAEGSIIDEPVVLYHLWDNKANYMQTRHLVMAEANSQSQVVEIYRCTSGTENTFHNTVTEVTVDKNAHFSYHKVQTECGENIHVGNTHISQASDSTVKCTTITTEGRMVRNNLNLTVDGSNCESHMYGLYLLHGTNHVDNHTTVDHRLPHSYSNELYKGIINDRAAGVFNGKIFVRQDAQKTNAFQSNKNLLLSDHASMNTKPQLEIWADDVKCSHGATTGQLDDEQLFYLRARGLDKQQARSLLLYAFAQETLEQVTSPVLKDYLDQVIQARLIEDHG